MTKGTKVGLGIAGYYSPYSAIIPRSDVDPPLVALTVCTQSTITNYVQYFIYGLLWQLEIYGDRFQCGFLGIARA